MKRRLYPVSVHNTIFYSTRRDGECQVQFGQIWENSTEREIFFDCALVFCYNIRVKMGANAKKRPNDENSNSMEDFDMRMRKMKNRDSRMEACADLRIAEPAARKGAWRELKPDATALWVEVGCGKGKFTAETAQANPDVLLIAVERCREAMVVAMEKAQNMGLKNVYFFDMDVANIEEIFAAGEIDRLFINFPDPWPRKKNAKRRLTHRGFLDKYCRVIKLGGEIHYKTDNAPLFAFSVEEFAACGLEVKNLTNNLHENGIVGIMTGYEEKFHALGTPINRCEVVCKPFQLPPEEKKNTEEEA